MFQRWERSYLELIEKKKIGFFLSLFRAFLFFLSIFYGAGVKFRNLLFSSGLRKSSAPSKALVISVGNVVAGGTGKTPVTFLLAEEFYRDYKIGLVSRGYRSSAEQLKDPVLLSSGQGPLHSALYCGDEPTLFSENFPEAIVVVGKNRIKGVSVAERKGVEIIFVDDGMQHRQLHRDYEIVVVDGENFLGNGHYLPRGTLRDDPRSLKRADFVIVNHAQNEECYQMTKEALANYTTAPVIGAVVEARNIFSLEGQQISCIKGMSVGIFCGIGKPDSFKKTVENLGAKIVDTFYCSDHQQFDCEQLELFAKKCLDKGAQLLLCTEKDKVRLIGGLSDSIAVAYVQVRLKIIDGIEKWQWLIQKIKEKLPEKR